MQKMAFKKETTWLNVSLFADAWNNENASILLKQDICSSSLDMPEFQPQFS